MQPVMAAVKAESSAFFPTSAFSGEEAINDGEPDCLSLVWKVKSGGSEVVSQGGRYPHRPGKPDCLHYLSTGLCGYGEMCKFNHPTIKKWIKITDGVDIKELRSSRKAKIECKFYLMPGGCKYGKSCKYSHRREKEEETPLNILGLPLRHEEQECQLYMLTGSCSFAVKCRFHHPEPEFVTIQYHHMTYQDFGFPEYRTTEEEETEPIEKYRYDPEEVSAVSILEPVFARYPIYEEDIEDSESDQTPRNTYYPPQEIENFPDDSIKNPQKECSKKVPSCDLNVLGLPLRQGKPVCFYFARYGLCKYGVSCKFDHPYSTEL